MLKLLLPYQKETIGDLVIVNGQLGHAGTYACAAQTVVDTATASAKLVVRGMQEMLPSFAMPNFVAICLQIFDSLHLLLDSFRAVLQSLSLYL